VGSRLKRKHAYGEIGNIEKGVFVSAGEKVLEKEKKNGKAKKKLRATR